MRLCTPRYGLRSPINQGVFFLKKRHPKDEGLDTDISDKEGMLHRNICDRIRQLYKTRTRQNGRPVRQRHLGALTWGNLKRKKRTNLLMDEIDGSTAVNQSLQNTRQSTRRRRGD
jgi:hypothetical protein